MADLQRGVSMDLRQDAEELREENRALRAEAHQAARRLSRLRAELAAARAQRDARAPRGKT